MARAASVGLALGLLGVALSISTHGCGSGSAPSCASAAAALCHRAAVCSADGTARILSPYMSTFAAAEHASESACNDYYQQLGCHESKADFAACEAAAPQASCVGSPPGVLFPDACDHL